MPRREDAPNRPFCCDRCQWRDLGRWFNEEYRVSEPISADSLDDESTPNPKLPYQDIDDAD